MLNVNAVLSLVVAVAASEMYYRRGHKWAYRLAVASAVASVVLTIGARLAYLGAF